MKSPARNRTSKSMPPPKAAPRRRSRIQLGMHTDNWRPLSGSFEQAAASAVEHKLTHIEFGLVDGQNFIQGLGYDPALPLDVDELRLRRYFDERGLQVS